jgi:hypothetical protein
MQHTGMAGVGRATMNTNAETSPGRPPLQALRQRRGPLLRMVHRLYPEAASPAWTVRLRFFPRVKQRPRPNCRQPAGRPLPRPGASAQTGRAARLAASPGDSTAPVLPRPTVADEQPESARLAVSESSTPLTPSWRTTHIHELPSQSLTGNTHLDALGNRRRRAKTTLRVRK